MSSDDISKQEVEYYVVNLLEHLTLNSSLITLVDLN